jgi:hypothetical protein
VTVICDAGAGLVASTFVFRQPDGVGSSQVVLASPSGSGMQEDLLVINQEAALTRYRLHAQPPSNHTSPRSNHTIK